MRHLSSRRRQKFVDQAVFGMLTRSDDMMYYASETGILTILCTWVLTVAMYLLMRKKLN